MSTDTNDLWEEIRKHYQVLDITIDRRPPYYDLEGSYRHGLERIELDFGSPDVDHVGESKIQYFIRMICAAPEMLEALERILPAAMALARKQASYDQFGDIDFAKAAIAKAKGETP